MKTLWETLIYSPIYNALIFIAQNITWQDVGIAVILITIIIRFALYPLSKKSVVGQFKMKALQPKIDAIKAKGLSKEDEAKETFALYKTENINPFSGCLYLLIQLPFLIALYFVFMHGVNQPEHLYSFLTTEGLNNMFLGTIDITKPFLGLAIAAGITQSLQAILMPKPVSTGDEKSFQNQLTKSLSIQTRFILPIIIVFIASKLAAAVSLYWVVTNLFSIAQDFYIRRQFTK